jgi:hypothetical protein
MFMRFLVFSSFPTVFVLRGMIYNQQNKKLAQGMVQYEDRQSCCSPDESEVVLESRERFLILLL